MAYALGPLRPDERHERIFVRRRSRRVFVILIALLAMLGSSGAFFALYRSMTRAPAPGDVPLIRADNTPTRHRPENPGGIQVPGQGTMVLDGGQGEPKVEHLLPPPEAPLPRPAASDPTAPPPAQAAEPPAAPAAAVPPQPVAEAPAAPAPQPAPPPVAVAEPPAKALPAPPPPAPAPPVAAKPVGAPAVAGKGWRLQVGAVRSPEAAQQEWQRLKRQHGEVLGKLSLATERVDLGARGIYYRIQAGPIADAAKAEQDCSELKRRGVSCILVKP